MDVCRCIDYLSSVVQSEYVPVAININLIWVMALFLGWILEIQQMVSDAEKTVILIVARK